jgi:cell filamentation protein
VLHPFREGNGRTTREFIRELAYKNGYLLDLREIEANDMLDASKLSIVDSTELEKLLYKCLKKA